MVSQHAHEVLLTPILHSAYRSSNVSVHLTPAEKQTLLLTLQRVSNSARTMINDCCSRVFSITIGKFDANTPETWLARHGHLLAELHVGKGVTEQQQLAAIAKGLHAANARPGGLQLQVFTGYTSQGMAAVLAELQGSSQHLTRLELQRANRFHEEEQHICVDAVKELLPQLQHLQVLTVLLSGDINARNFRTFVPRRTISVGHLSHLTSLKFGKALVSASEGPSAGGLPSSLQQLQLHPVLHSIKPMMQLPAGLHTVHLNIGWTHSSSKRQQLLENLAAQCTKLKEVRLEYRPGPHLYAMVFISRAEMAAWALLPVRMLHFAHLDFVGPQAAQLFPQLLAATHKHLTELHLESRNVQAVKQLPMGLAQLTGLRKLHLDIGTVQTSSFERRQLLEQVAAQCTSLREVGLEYTSTLGNPVALLDGREMAAWALLPVCSLNLANISIPDPTDVQQFSRLLAATHQHLSKLTLVCPHEVVAERLHVGLAQLTGLVTLQLSGIPRTRLEQLFEVVAPQLVNLRHLKLMDMHVSNAVVQHLSAARSLMSVYLFDCTWDDGVDDGLKSILKYVRLEQAS